MDFEGWKDSVRLTNGTIDTVTLTAVGPRVIRYGFVDGPNAFHIVPKDRGQTGGDEFRCYGGHRLWLAPEAMPRSYFPDNSPVETVEAGDKVVRLANATEPLTGVSKEIEIKIASEGPAVMVTHRLTNNNIWPVTLAPWALTVVANGGYAVLPQEPYVSHDDELLPARPLVLWKFTDMSDPRWRWGRKYITLRQDDAGSTPQKVGAFVSHGWGAHVTPTQVFVKLIPTGGRPAEYPDEGSNFEAYTEGAFQELETLGRICTLEPGETTDHREFWYLARTAGIPDNDDALDEMLMPIVDEAQKAAMHMMISR